MDVDLSTDLARCCPRRAAGQRALRPGDRHPAGRDSRVVRGPKRELISRSYNLLLRGRSAPGSATRSAASRRSAATRPRELLPLVEDNAWFFDTELLVVAERAGLRIHEVPVDWVDDPDSRVDIVRTALDDLRGIARLGRACCGGTAAARGRRAPRPGQLRRRRGRLGMQVVMFGWSACLRRSPTPSLYLLLRSAVAAQVGQPTALLVTAVANTAANRRFTFGVSGPRDAYGTSCRGWRSSSPGSPSTSGSLWLLHAVRHRRAGGGGGRADRSRTSASPCCGSWR